MYSQKHAYLSEDPTVLSKQHNWSQSLASNNVVIKSSLQNVLPMKRKDMAVLSWHTFVILYYTGIIHSSGCEKPKTSNMHWTESD